MGEEKTTKTVTKLVFIYPDTRAGSPNTVIGEGFEVCEADGDSIVRGSNGVYSLTISIKKTVIEKIDGKKDKVKVVDTGLKKTINILPKYLWVEEETVQVPVAE